MLYIEEDNFVAPDILHVPTAPKNDSRTSIRGNVPRVMLRIWPYVYHTRVTCAICRGPQAIYPEQVLKQMIEVAETNGGGKVGVLDLGLKMREAVNDDGTGWQQKSSSVSVEGWESSKHNMGMAFNRQFWDKMAAYVTLVNS